VQFVVFSTSSRAHEEIRVLSHQAASVVKNEVRRFVSFIRRVLLFEQAADWYDYAG
jgi:hypothetical protein